MDEVAPGAIAVEIGSPEMPVPAPIGAALTVEDAAAPTGLFDVIVTGQTVVYTGIIDVIVTVEWAGQFVTLGAQLVTVMSEVEKTVDVVNRVVEGSSAVPFGAPDVIGEPAVVAELLAVSIGTEAVIVAVGAVADCEALPLDSKNPPPLLEAGLSAVESPGVPDMVIVIVTVTGTIVVTGTTAVLTAVDRAGQSVTTELQLMTVCTRVL